MNPLNKDLGLKLEQAIVIIVALIHQLGGSAVITKEELQRVADKDKTFKVIENPSSPNVFILKEVDYEGLL